MASMLADDDERDIEEDSDERTAAILCEMMFSKFLNFFQSVGRAGIPDRNPYLIRWIDYGS